MHQELGHKVLITCGQGEGQVEPDLVKVRVSVAARARARAKALERIVEVQVSAYPGGKMVNMNSPMLFAAISC